MGYCDEGCEHLTSRHNCNKYHKGLAYFSRSGRGLSYSSHERCIECEKDHIIKDLENKLKERWIPVSERMPETNRQVLAQWELPSRIYNAVSVYTEIMRWNGGMWISDKGVPVGQTVAWMPLPEPYRPDQDN